MDDLFELLAELVDALEQRDASEPEMGWQAGADVQRLERRLVAEFRAAGPRLFDERPDRFLVATH